MSLPDGRRTAPYKVGGSTLWLLITISYDSITQGQWLNQSLAGTVLCQAIVWGAPLNTHIPGMWENFRSCHKSREGGGWSVCVGSPLSITSWGSYFVMSDGLVERGCADLSPSLSLSLSLYLFIFFPPIWDLSEQHRRLHYLPIGCLQSLSDKRNDLVNN